MLDPGLESVHVLVSGANGGIGLPTVQLFLRQGATVTAHYNTTASALSSDPEIQDYQSKGKYQAIQADMADEDAVERLYNQAEEGFHGDVVKILVVNHAIYIDTPTPLSRMTLDRFTKTHTVNLTGSFLLIRRYLQGLEKVKQEKSVEALGENVGVVLIGSTAAEFGEANHADYASSKSALTHGLMLSLKNEIVKIHPRARVNTIAPGWVATPMAEKSMQDENIKYMAMATKKISKLIQPYFRTPLKKIATPEDVANQIVLLSSQKLSGHVTGQIVRLHGGMEGELLPREDVQMLTEYIARTAAQP